MRAFDFQLPTRVVFGAGTIQRLGQLAHELSIRRALVVADRGIVAAGHAGRAIGMLDAEGIATFRFHDFESNPDSTMVDAGRAAAAAARIDGIVAVGGGSSLDCAKGINFVLTNGGTMRDYWGYGKASQPMLPMIGVPTTAGTGSDGQSYALIRDTVTHAKMACGDRKALFRTVILDPELTVSQPPGVTAAAGFDAISHVVESYVTTRRNAVSDLFARSAWTLLEPNHETILAEPDNLEARGAMLLGAHAAGVAIEQSMLGAAHACANPLTARYGTTHGHAIAVMLPRVVRWNADVVTDRYAQLLRLCGHSADRAGEQLADRLAALAQFGGLPATLRDLGVSRADFAALAADAANQWTGRFNPRPLDEPAARGLYEAAY